MRSFLVWTKAVFNRTNRHNDPNNHEALSDPYSMAKLIEKVSGSKPESTGIESSSQLSCTTGDTDDAL